jgi:hypothetical protein
MKDCIKCGERKPLSAFYKHKQMKDGHLNKCKECTKSDVRSNREANIDYYREYDRSRDRRGTAEDTRKYREKNPVKYYAHQLVTTMVRAGRIVKPEFCEECSSIDRVEGHHDDYAKPLEVRWLCSLCHKKWHKENGPGKNGF